MPRARFVSDDRLCIDRKPFVPILLVQYRCAY